MSSSWKFWTSCDTQPNDRQPISRVASVNTQEAGTLRRVPGLILRTVHPPVMTNGDVSPLVSAAKAR